MSPWSSESKVRRYAAAKAIEMDWESALPPRLFRMLQLYSTSYGVPIDFFFMPLLTITSSMMNHCQFSGYRLETWTEPAILWTVVNAPAGKCFKCFIK